MPNNTTPEIEVIAGRIYEVRHFIDETNSARTNTVIHKQELYGAGDVKKDQTMRLELEAAANASDKEEGGDGKTPTTPTTTG